MSEPREAPDDGPYQRTWMDSLDEVLDEAVTRDEGVEFTAEGDRKSVV